MANNKTPKLIIYFYVNYSIRFYFIALEVLDERTYEKFFYLLGT